MLLHHFLMEGYRNTGILPIRMERSFFLKKIKRSGGLLLNIQKRLSSIWKIMAINLFPEMRINLLLY